MSQIDQLIAELCPEGVEFRRVEDAAVSRRTPRGVRREDYKLGTQYPIVDQGQAHIAGYTDDNSVTIPTGEYIVFGDHTCAVKWVDFEFAPGADGTKVLQAATGIISKFLYYAIANLDIPSRGYNRHWTILRELRIPIPPLEIQREIVKVLDTFTQLEAELEAELEARRRQYQYYRDALLSFDERMSGASKQASKQARIRWATLGEIFNMRAGQHISASQISGEPDERHAYPCFGGNGIRGFVKNYSHDGAHLLIGRQGALCGNIQRTRGKFYATEHAVVVTANDDINVDWAFHMLTLMNLNQYASKSAQPGLAVGRLEEVQIAVPPLEEQGRIVAILDKFDALVNDLSSGLLAEIKARRQQYEHYRDRLLSFKEAA